MALFHECTLQCAQKELDTADIVREAIWTKPLRGGRYRVFAGRHFGASQDFFRADDNG